MNARLLILLFVVLAACASVRVNTQAIVGSPPVSGQAADTAPSEAGQGAGGTRTPWMADWCTRPPSHLAGRLFCGRSDVYDTARKAMRDAVNEALTYAAMSRGVRVQFRDGVTSSYVAGTSPREEKRSHTVISGGPKLPCVFVERHALRAGPHGGIEAMALVRVPVSVEECTP